MSHGELFAVSNGLASFGPELVEIRAMLDRRWLAWAAESNAESRLYPPLMRVEDLDGLDYFRNFPHLALIVSPIRTELLSEKYISSKSISAIPETDLVTSEYALPSAACYNIYLHMGDTVLQQSRYITTVASCFRNEEYYSGLQRLWGFTMREIVCIGSADSVKAHLGAYKDLISSFATQIGLPLEIQAATDPFYQSQNSRALMQQIFPVKEEFVYGGKVAIASLNFHRNFFGERCRISTEDGKAAFSGCVAFGIERWLHALVEEFHADVAAIESAIAI